MSTTKEQITNSTTASEAMRIYNNEREAREQEDAARVERVTGLTAEEQLIRMAIFDVFDSPNPDAPRFFFEGQQVRCANGGHETVSETVANRERLDFADLVLVRTRQLKGLV